MATAVDGHRLRVYDVVVDERRRSRVLVVGWRGGVGRALMGLMSRHPMGRALAGELEGCLLVDAADAPTPVELPPQARVLPRRPIRHAGDLAELVDAHRVGLVIDLAGLGTLDCVEVCARRGVDTLCTSLEHWPQAEIGRRDAYRTLPYARNLVPPGRPLLEAGSHLVGSGMNPGLVSALVHSGLRRFAELADAEAPTAEALDLYAIALTEEDTTHGAHVPPDAFAMTWSPRFCLDELYEPTAMMISHGVTVELDHPPHAALYRARCGDRLVDGHMVPHDELVTLGDVHPGVELAYFYRLPPQAEAFLARKTSSRPETFATARLEPGPGRSLRGHDRIGALLCSRRYGELWVGFENDVRDGEPYATNATELQVAVGVLAGWRQLGTVRGLHTVEVLDCIALIEDAQSALGSIVEHHDPHARIIPLRARRVCDVPAAVPTAS